MLSFGVLLLLPAVSGSNPGWQRNAPIDAVRAATVMIEVLGPRGRSTGSGFVVAGDGTIATAAHVVQGAWMVRVRLASGQVLPVLGLREVDPRLDLALLAAPAAGIPPVRLGDSDSVRIGQRLLALGCPFGLDVSVADGLLSALPSPEGYPLLQISVPISPGMSGGPVFTEDGEVVGLVVSGLRVNGAENINFALPFNYGRERLAMVLSRGPAPVTRWSEAELVGLETMSEGSERLPLPPVNQALALDFEQVDGVEVLTRWKRPDGVGFASLLKVGLSLSPNGEVIVERLRETRATQDGEIGTETHRTIYRLGPQNLFSTTVRFTPVDGRAKEQASALNVHGDHYSLTDLGGAFRNGPAPEGVLPVALADVAVAARRGEMSGPFEFLVLDPYGERLIKARIEITGRGRREIPLAKNGASCGGKPKVARSEVDVLTGVLEIGLDRGSVTLLASSPYLILDHTVKCVRLPRPGREAGQPS